MATIHSNLLTGKDKGDTGAAAPVSFSTIIATLQEGFDRYLFLYFPDPDVQLQAQLILVTMASQIRESFVVSETDLDQVWEIVRSEKLDRLVDFLHTLLSDVLLYNPGVTVENLSNQLARSLHSASRIYPNRDPDFNESLMDQASMTTILTNNPWYLTILLLKRTGKLNLTRSQPVAARSSGTKMPTFDELLELLKEHVTAKPENQMVTP